MSKTLYLVASQGSGEACLHQGRYYPEYAHAQRRMEDYHARGMPYMKIFEIDEYRVVNVLFDGKTWAMDVPVGITEDNVLQYLKENCNKRIEDWWPIHEHDGKTCNERHK